jgi:hypothetical protein
VAFEEIEKHLVDLGVEPLGGGGHVPVGDEVWGEVAPQGGAHVPEVLRRLFARFGGFRFPEGALYHDPRYGGDVMVGWFLDGQEMLEAFEDTRDALPENVVPVSNDGGDNHLAVGVGPDNSGVVYFHVHDAPAGSNLYVVDDSVEHFLASLHREP